MANNKIGLLDQLCVMGLSRDEALIYLELLTGPTTHAKLAKVTGINRTKVYRIADELEKRSIIAKRIDDRGMALVAADPSALEVEILAQEEELGRKRAAFRSLLPAIKNLRNPDTGFVVNTYVGENGFKQMLWNELKAKGELLALGGCELEDLVVSRHWTERYRDRAVSAGYYVRELVNGSTVSDSFTVNKEYLKRYEGRCISREIITFGSIMTIYNDTVATYSFGDEDKRVGFEVVNASHANAMRQVFESYWELAEQRVLRPSLS